MAEYKVTWGWYDGECNSEYYDGEYAESDALDCASEAKRFGNVDWCNVYRNGKCIKSYDKISESENNYFQE